MINISTKIKELRELNNLSQTQLANILNVSQKAVSNWENGNDFPKVETLINIYRNFGISPNEFLELDLNISYPSKSNDYTELECELVENYRECSKVEQGQILGYAEAFANMRKQQDKNKDII